MSSILGALSVFAFFPMIITGMIAYGSIRDRDAENSMKFGLIFAGLLIFIVLAPKGERHSSGSDCSIEWDARATRTVCN